MPDVPLIGGFYKSASLPVSSKECVNWIINVPQTDTFAKGNLFGTAGLLEITAALTGEVNRGGWDLAGKPYVVNGTKLYRVDRTFNALNEAVYSLAEVGTGLTGIAQVMMRDNGTQLCIVLPESNDQFNAFIYTEADGLIQISDPSFQGPVSSVDYVDSFFSFTKQDSNVIFISDVNDGLTYDATDSATARVDPDNNVGQIVFNNQWFVGGARTIQPFQNHGGTDFPFTTIPGDVIQKGFSSQFAIIELSTEFMFLGKGKFEQPAIWATNGGKPEKRSTTAIDNAISKYSDATVAAAYALKTGQAGHYRVYFTFPGEDTYVYHEESGIWATVESIENDQVIPWRVQTVIDAYGELIIADIISPKIGILDFDTGTEFGEIMRRSVVLQPLDQDGLPFTVDAFELLVEAGTANLNGDGSAPTVLASFSEDGGVTFNTPMPLSMGLTGERQQRLIWTQWGLIERNIVIKLEVSDPNKMAFIKADIWLS